MSEFKEWRQTMRVNSKKMAAMEKEFPKMLPFSMTTELRPLIEGWLDEQQQQINSRFKEQAAMLNRLSAIKGGIDQLRETLKFFERKDNYLLKIQNVSEGIINKMDGFKSEMARDYEKHASVEDNLLKELDILEVKVDQYQRNEIIAEDPNQVKYKQIPIKQKIKPEEETCAQNHKPTDNEGIQRAILNIEDHMRELTRTVEEVEMEIRGLGKNFGWSQDDHNNFVMLWNRRKNNNYFQFQQECFQHLKMYTMDQIRSHFQKHKSNLELNQRRKDVLYQYKLQKEKKRGLQLQLIEKKQKEERVHLNRAKKEVDKAKDEKETRERLQNWKIMKQAQKEVEDRERFLDQQKRREEIISRKREVEEKKAVVAEWKQFKEVEKEESKQPVRPRSAVNKETLDRIRRKEDQLLMKKTDILKAKESKEAEKVRKEQLIKEKKFVEFNYVKSKLDQKTTAIKEKQRTKYDGTNPKEANTFGGNLGLVHARAVPNWRQGL